MNCSNPPYELKSAGVFEDEEMIEAAREQLSGHGGNRMFMVRDAAVYETLALIPKMVIRLAKRVAQDA